MRCLAPVARIYEVFPLVCPLCGGNMRIMAFITEGVQIRRILEPVDGSAECRAWAVAQRTAAEHG